MDTDEDNTNDDQVDHENELLGDNLGAPSSIDWRQQGAVTSIKDQGRCNGCYAFSAAVDMEGAYKIKYGKLMDFSAQQLIDCTGP